MFGSLFLHTRKVLLKLFIKPSSLFWSLLTKFGSLLFHFRQVILILLPKPFSLSLSLLTKVLRLKCRFLLHLRQLLLILLANWLHRYFVLLLGLHFLDVLEWHVSVSWLFIGYFLLDFVDLSYNESTFSSEILNFLIISTSSRSSLSIFQYLQKIFNFAQSLQINATLIVLTGEVFGFFDHVPLGFILFLNVEYIINLVRSSPFLIT